MASETGSTIVLLEGKLEFDDVTLRAIADVYTSEGNKEIKKYRKKGYKNAIYFFTEGIKVNCKDDEINANLYSNRALAYFMLGSYQESLNDAKVATELQPTHIESLEMGARACLELHLYEEAIGWCNKGLAIVVSNSAILSDLWTECTNKISPNTLTTTPDSLSVDGQESDVSLQQTVRKQVGLTAIKAHHLGSTNATLDDIKTATDHHKHLCKEKLRYRAVEGRTYGILGKAFRKLGDLETAISYFEKYLKIAKDVGDKASEGIASGCLGEAYKHLEDYRKALHYFEICLVIRKEVGDKAGEGNTLSNLGNVYWSLGDLKSAANCHEIHLQIAKELGDVDGQGIAYNNLGNIYRIFGKVEKAIDFHERHLKIAKELGDKPGEGIAYGNLGIAYRVIGDFKTAVDYHQLNLKIAKEVGDRSSEGTAYFNLGNDYHSLGDFKTSLSYHELSLKIAKKVGNRAQEGSACGCIGSMHTSLGNIQSAVHYLELHLKIAKELGKKDDEGMAYGRLGIAHHILGDLETAMVYYKDHLKIAKEVGDRGGEGNAYGNLGRAYNSIGEFKKAIEYFEKQLNVAKEMRNRAQEGIAYGGLGSTYQSLGNFKRAINYNELNLQIAKEVRDRAGEGRAYGNLGSDYLNVGNFKRAIDYHELHLGIAKEVGDKAGQGHAYGNLCEAYRRLGNYKKCMVHHELNLKIAKEVGDKAEEGRANCCIGNVYLNLEDFEKAVSCHTTYLKIAKEVGNRRGEGTAYGNLGVAHHLLGDFEKAIHYHGLHFEVAKEVGDRAAEGSACGNLGTVHCLLGEFEKAKHFNELHLKIAKETGDKAEEAKAYYFLGRTFGSMGSLLEAVNHCESSVKILNDITFRAQFKDEMKIDLRHLYQNAYTSLWCLYLTQGKILQALLAAEQGRAQALTHLMELNYGFETDVVDSHTLDETVYEKLSATSSNTVFIATGVKEIFFWVSSYDQKGKYIKLELGIKEISDNYWWGDVDNFFRSLIQDAFKEIGVRGGVKCEDRSLDDLRDETPANESPDQKNVSSSSLQLQSTSLRTLYDFIIAPVADFIHGSDIVIVPEAPLCLLPHAAFMDSNLKYLSESHRIRVVPSLTSLKLLADCPADYHCKTGALLVGDPWVQEFKYKGRKLHQLPCAREEVEMIGRILKTEPLTGTNATKDAVLQRLSSVALVHIAAHGRMETGEITLAPNPTRSTEKPTEKDFLLTMADVLSVQIRARLVVLSCCHSGRGEIKAEGVVGIARAFMGAGARSVLVSLWAIDDAATLEFMKIFYVHLTLGRSASEALKQAMKCMRESDEFNEVKYWAPFVLIGDDVTLEFGASD